MAGSAPAIVCSTCLSSLQPSGGAAASLELRQRVTETAREIAALYGHA